MKTLIGVNGACGRMGQRIVQLAHEDKELTLGAALESAGHPQQGRDIGEVTGLGPLGVTVRPDIPLEQRLDVVIDFSTPEGTMAVLPTCVQRRIPLVVATTGHTAAQRQEIEAAAHETALLMAPNMSLAVNLLMKLVRQAAEALRGRNFDVEILERHHRYKKDSPSGTALHLARITIVFSTLGETLELTHRAHARDCYARGALQAAKFLAGRPAGRYTMNDVLGL